MCMAALGADPYLTGRDASSISAVSTIKAGLACIRTSGSEIGCGETVNADGRNARAFTDSRHTTSSASYSVHHTHGRNDMARRTQQQAVLDWLKTGTGISSMDAFKALGVTRLSAVVFNLRKKGYNIESEEIEVTTRFGNKVKIARYYLKDTVDNGENVL